MSPGKKRVGAGKHSFRIPRVPLKSFGAGLLALSSMMVLSACSLTGEFVPRNDSGFHYLDYPGSPYDQIAVPNPAINQIQCPPPSRPICGG